MLINDMLTEFDAITASGERAGPAVLAMLNEHLRRADETLCMHGEFEIPGGNTAGVQIDRLLGDWSCALVLSDDGYGSDRGVVFPNLADMERAVTELRPLFKPEPEPATPEPAQPKGSRPVVVVAGGLTAAPPKGVDVVHLHPGYHLSMAVHVRYFEDCRDRPDVVQEIKSLAKDADLTQMPGIVDQLRYGTYPTTVKLSTGERRVLARLLENDMDLPAGHPSKVWPEQDDLFELDDQGLLDKLLWESALVKIPGPDQATINFNVDNGEIDYL